MDNRKNKMPSQGLYQGIVPNLQLTAMQCKPEVALVPHWPTSPSYHQPRKKCQKTYPRNPCANQLEVVVHTLLHPKNLLPSSQGHLECPLHVTQQMWGAPKFLAVRDSIHRVPFWSYNFLSCNCHQGPEATRASGDKIVPQWSKMIMVLLLGHV